MPRSASTGSSPPQSPIYPTTPPPVEFTYEMPHSKRPLSPMSLRALSSPTASLTRPSSFPPPPTGHDLMNLFPSAAPALHDVDIVRESTAEAEIRIVGGHYVNTSSWFGNEERKFFSSGDKTPIAGRNSLERDRSMKRRRSIKEENHLSSPQIYSPVLAQPRALPSSPVIHPSSHSNPPQPSHPPTESPYHAVSGSRRRAGKYTKRVFVQSTPSSVHSSSPSPSPSSSYHSSPPPNHLQHVRPPHPHAYLPEGVQGDSPPSKHGLVPVKWEN
ncbi:hypothetical protein M422DRAFT_780520 [Sphaerobolus stellatus SS14]|uniref:Uncharacterized protein n=1 Tax=Sphaerobolus stellatus (strain SS14) TaxID=990650 RepID=A0A0C9VRW4_SPHS4|nr:hypothetical protein M422DRAFT_780520 [Sphaerobolus stellatus SS14]